MVILTADHTTQAPSTVYTACTGATAPTTLIIYIGFFAGCGASGTLEAQLALEHTGSGGGASNDGELTRERVWRVMDTLAKRRRI